MFAQSVVQHPVSWSELHIQLDPVLLILICSACYARHTYLHGASGLTLVCTAVSGIGD